MLKLCKHFNHKMSATTVIECPICMDPIETTRNCLTTECGHCFHTNCLMTSVAHNGFGCPYCRTKMAEEISEDEESEYDDESEDDNYENPTFCDYSLLGFRLFNNIINGDEHYQADLDEEDEMNRMIEEFEPQENTNANEETVDEVKPPTSHITQKLLEQGVTMESLVKILLMSVDEYDRDFDDFERIEKEMCGRVRTILNNYTPPV